MSAKNACLQYGVTMKDLQDVRPSLCVDLHSRFNFQNIDDDDDIDHAFVERNQMPVAIVPW